MAKRESDTSESEALFDALVDGDVLTVGDDGDVRTTDAFDDTLAVYHDSYVGIGDEEFHRAVAATFGLPDSATAAELVAERGVTRWEFVCYLAVESHLDAERESDDASAGSAADDLAVMAGMVHEVVPDSPVPDGVPDVTDDPEAFVAGHDRAVVSVWKRFCTPCESLKESLPDLLDALPEDVAVAGIDGEVAVEFCETHEVESAPGFVCVRGDDARTHTGSGTEDVAATLRATYPD